MNLRSAAVFSEIKLQERRYVLQFQTRTQKVKITKVQGGLHVRDMLIIHRTANITALRIIVEAVISAAELPRH